MAVILLQAPSRRIVATNRDLEQMMVDRVFRDRARERTAFVRAPLVSVVPPGCPMVGREYKWPRIAPCPLRPELTLRAPPAS